MHSVYTTSIMPSYPSYTEKAQGVMGSDRHHSGYKIHNLTQLCRGGLKSKKSVLVLSSLSCFLKRWGDIEGRKLLALWADFMYLMIEYNVIFYCQHAWVSIYFGWREEKEESHLDRNKKVGGPPQTYCLQFSFLT